MASTFPELCDKYIKFVEEGQEFGRVPASITATMVRAALTSDRIDDIQRIKFCSDISKNEQWLAHLRKSGGDSATKVIAADLGAVTSQFLASLDQASDSDDSSSGDD